jgi:hypothetical protein
LSDQLQSGVTEQLFRARIDELDLALIIEHSRSAQFR